MKMMSNRWTILAVLMVAFAPLIGCGEPPARPAPEPVAVAPSPTPDPQEALLATQKAEREQELKKRAAAEATQHTLADWELVAKDPKPKVDWESSENPGSPSCRATQKAYAAVHILEDVKGSVGRIDVRPSDATASLAEDVPRRSKAVAEEGAKALFALLADPTYEVCVTDHNQNIDFGDPLEVRYALNYILKGMDADTHTLGGTKEIGPKEIRAMTLVGIRKTVPPLATLAFRPHVEGTDSAKEAGDYNMQVHAKRQIGGYLAAGFTAEEIGFKGDPKELEVGS